MSTTDILFFKARNSIHHAITLKKLAALQCGIREKRKLPENFASIMKYLGYAANHHRVKLKVFLVAQSQSVAFLGKKFVC